MLHIARKEFKLDSSEIKLQLRHRDWLLKHGSHGEYKKKKNKEIT